MVRDAFRRWLEDQPYQANTKSTQWSQASRLEKHYGDLDAAYDADQFTAIKADMQYSKEDEREGRPNPSRLEITGDVYANLSSYRTTLAYYSNFRASEGETANTSPTVIDRDELERLKVAFLKRYPDFAGLGFGAETGSYWEDERAYKDVVIGRVGDLLSSQGSDQQVGEALLYVLQQPPANFVGWRTFAQIKDAGEGNAAAVATALGRMLRDPSPVTQVAAGAAATIHPLLSGGSLDNPSYGQVRSLVTTALALARPDEAIAVKTRFMQRAAKQLLGRALFKQAVMTAPEYREVVSFGLSILGIMREEWRWAPRDLWDVQGFLWVTSELYDGDRFPRSDEDEQQIQTIMPKLSTSPTNLILYGPPGTGKTYRTAAAAVQLCAGLAKSDPLLQPDQRDALMSEYRRLVSENRIEFVTFHQSYAYEDFVEGLRPTTDAPEDFRDDEANQAAASATGGFRLQSRDGIFKRICERAKLDRGEGDASHRLDRRRAVFKVSLGRRGEQEDRVEDGLRENLIHLGWGGDIDWSEERFDSFDEIRSEWKTKKDPDASGNNPNIVMTWSLRAAMQIGDYVVVSDGRDALRAFGRVVSDYFYELDAPYHPHRRKVEWLWKGDISVERSRFYASQFRQQSIYQLRPTTIDWDALEDIVFGGDQAQTPSVGRPYVLVIDEINRANVSKVFGELITLIEPDKRLGAANALTVTLPYSQEGFGVPSNLHIVGTMNTADRSIALLDTALRRRFEFEELMPEPRTLSHLATRTGVDVAAVLEGLNNRVEYLFDRDHQIGHAFFIGCNDLSDLNRVMRTKVIPLLAEYFYENWEKVRLVLGERTDDGVFVRRSPLKAPKGVDAYQSDEQRWRYVVLADYSADAYEQLKA